MHGFPDLPYGGTLCSLNILRSSVIPNQPFQAYLELLWVTHQINCLEAHPVALNYHIFID